MRVIFYYSFLLCVGLLLIVVNTNASLVSIISLGILIICCTIGLLIDYGTVNRKYREIVRRKRQSL